MQEWHCIAKLRLQTKATMRHFDELGPKLGNLLRKFKKTVCAKYITKELPREVQARGRRTALLAAQGKALNGKEGGTSRTVPFNFATYKAHSLPDYPDAIRRLGTTDNFTTQFVSALLIFFSDFLTSYFRVNWSTNVQRVSIREHRRRMSLTNLQSTNVVSD